MPIKSAKHDFMPNAIKVNTESAIADYPKYTAKILLDKQSGKYKGTLPNNIKISIINKKSHLIVVLYDVANKKSFEHFFHKEGLTLPEAGKYYKPFFTKKDYHISSLEIVSSYPFWTADILSHGYSLLSFKEIGMIELFPYVLTDITHRLCLSNRLTDSLLRILNHQNMDCKALTQGFKKMLTNEKLTSFQKRVDRQRHYLTKVLECSSGLRQTGNCKIVTQEMSKRVLDIKNIRDVLGEFK